MLIRYTVSGQDAQNSSGAMSCHPKPESCHPKFLAMLLKEIVISKTRLADCKLAIKLHVRHLFHLSGFHFQQHHEDFDYAENNQINRIEIMFE